VSKVPLPLLGDDPSFESLSKTFAPTDMVFLEPFDPFSLIDPDLVRLFLGYVQYSISFSFSVDLRVQTTAAPVNLKPRVDPKYNKRY